ncbi:MAG TPA: Ig domain-containing protein [Candidatus Binatia bacterium]|nr:Ig domain-containing protein [Candidatus Binatia bacterium]
MLNVTVVPAHKLGYLTVWPTGSPQPMVSTLNSLDGRIKAVAAVVGAGVGGGIDVFATNNTDLVLDVVGYFVSPGNPDALFYYPLRDLCELVNTVNPPSPDGLGGPALANGERRDFSVTNNPNCSIPSEAVAYSLNVIATPMEGAPLGYLTIWPSDQAMPYTSTLNSMTGTAVANAAIVTAGTGTLAVYASGTDTHVQIDLNGYFGPANIGSKHGNALYAFSPCRATDTRPTSFTNEQDYILQVQGGCQATLPPWNSQPPVKAFVLNATVVPDAGLGYFPIWAYKRPMPRPTTIIATDGAITSNMAIVPAGDQNEISAFASASTNLIYDVFGYFASPELTILTQSLPPGVEHVQYGPFTMLGRGGVPPYTWGSPNMPPDLGIDAATGAIAGCPTFTGSPMVTVTLTDSSLAPAPPMNRRLDVFSLPVLDITTFSLPPGTVYTQYAPTPLTATGGYTSPDGNYQWSVVAGSLPPGFSLSTNGVITGYDPGVKGTFYFKVQVTDQECPAGYGTTTQWLHIRIS